jgi:hypothetical protein
MGKNADFASLLTGGLQGGQAGMGAAAGLKMAGMAPGPWTPWLIGGGLALGALGGYMGNKADEEDPEFQAAQRREKGLSMFRSGVGRALKARRQPANFGEMINGSP